MRLVFPEKVENALRYLKLKFLPKTLFFRTMLLIFIPLIVVQIVSIFVFFDSNWWRVGRQLSSNLTADMAYVIKMVEDNPDEIEKIKETTAGLFNIDLKVFDKGEKYTVIDNSDDTRRMATKYFRKALDRQFSKENVNLYMDPKSNDMVIVIKGKNRTYEFTASEKKIFSSSMFLFVLWMVVTSLLLFLVAVLFLRVQVRSIAELAQVAEDFGKGIDNKTFKPYGSSEVRKAAFAFIKMKERIQRQISERTQMLAGVSHDLRTPLTRMKLQVALLPDGEDKKDFLSDIEEMEKMLDGYLSFVSGEGGEKSTFVDINEMILSIINKFRNKKALIRYSTNDQVSAIQGREQALKRALTNVISNAFRYGKTIAVKLESNDRKLEVSIDDDGPGIPADKREDVFKAFYRLEGSRNKETGGVGLGLSIAKDVIASHGGTIELADSELGGLKVQISIPL